MKDIKKHQQKKLQLQVFGNAANVEKKCIVEKTLAIIASIPDVVVLNDEEVENGQKELQRKIEKIIYLELAVVLY